MLTIFWMNSHTENTKLVEYRNTHFIFGLLQKINICPTNSVEKVGIKQNQENLSLLHSLFIFFLIKYFCLHEVLHERILTKKTW
mmetsp:Transcript_4300/g.6419  ORF Transcript_4300/g.6419 Transcript_4300/m.6419 type:complete len:84 (-) Transcript_4300:253-504(-)